jgi:hypothetical protein
VCVRVCVESAQAGDEELLKRLRYARDVLAHLLAAPSASVAAVGSTAAGPAAPRDDEGNDGDAAGLTSSPGGP